MTDEASSDRDETWTACRRRAAAPSTGAVPTTTGSTPATRREAHATPRARRPRAGGRAGRRLARMSRSPRSDSASSSRAARSADLLTADRLLDPHQVVRPEPEGAWQHFVYSITGHRVNLGDGKRARARKELDRRIAAPLERRRPLRAGALAQGRRRQDHGHDAARHGAGRCPRRPHHRGRRQPRPRHARRAHRASERQDRARPGARARRGLGLQRRLRRSSPATRRGWTCWHRMPIPACPKRSATATTTTSPRSPRTTTRSC